MNTEEIEGKLAQIDKDKQVLFDQKDVIRQQLIALESQKDELNRELELADLREKYPNFDISKK